VADPNQVVTVGQRVKVRVISVDLQRNRIALTMKKQASADGRSAPNGARPDRAGQSRPPAKGSKPPASAPKSFVVPKPGAIAPNGMRFK
jgi:uncharacterized protein